MVYVRAAAQGESLDRISEMEISGILPQGNSFVRECTYWESTETPKICQVLQQPQNNTVLIAQ